MILAKNGQLLIFAKPYFHPKVALGFMWKVDSELLAHLASDVSGSRSLLCSHECTTVFIKCPEKSIAKLRQRREDNLSAQPKSGVCVRVFLSWLVYSEGEHRMTELHAHLIKALVEVC